jgi:hypothetical protein
MPVLYTLVKTAPSPTTATDSSGPKVGHLFSKTQHPRHHSVYKKHSFSHEKFGMGRVIFFTRKSMFNKMSFFMSGFETQQKMTFKCRLHEISFSLLFEDGKGFSPLMHVNIVTLSSDLSVIVL